MHQVVFEGWHEPAHARCTRARASFDGGAAGDRRKGRGGHGPSSSVAGALGLRVLTSDPLLELLRGGALSMRDLRALLLCTGSEAIRGVAEERARLQLAAGARALRATRRAFALCASRVRGVALDAEARLLQLGVPMLAVHPELSSPLREGQASHHALYADLSSLHTVLRAASHPATWAEPAAAAGGPADGEALAAVEAGAGAAGSSGSLWDALAGSAGLCMRPQLVLMLSALLPVEARLAYLGLRHAAYAGPGVCDLGGLVKAVLLRMMLHPYGPQDLRRAAKQLRAVAPGPSPFNLWLLRQVAAGSAAATGAPTFAQQQAARAADEERLSAAVDALFEEQQEQVLYSHAAWVRWLQGQPTRHLVGLYLKYLADAFQ